MGNEKIHVVSGQPGIGQGLFHGCSHDAGRELENFPTLHLHEVTPFTNGLFRCRLRGTPSGDPEQLRAGAVASDRVAKDTTRLVARTQHDRTGAISKEHTRRSVSIIDHSGEHFDANDKDMVGAAIGNELVCGRKGVEKAAAGGLYVKSSTPCSQRVLYEISCRRKGVIRAYRGDNNKSKILAFDSRAFQSLACRRNREG